MSEPLSEIDEYFRELHRLARICADNSAAPHEFVENPPEDYRAAVERCQALRAHLLSESEESTISAYFELGLFQDLPRRARLAAFAFAFDLQHAVDALSIQRQCEPGSNHLRTFCEKSMTHTNSHSNQRRNCAQDVSQLPVPGQNRPL
jgi:hypothetical protein